MARPRPALSTSWLLPSPGSLVVRVYITVDVECREERRVGGATQPAAGYDLRVFGKLANQPGELGVGFIMRELDAFGLKATFFVEPLGSTCFGMDGLLRVCQTIRDRSHEVQLHAHPIQERAFWISRGETPPADNMADYGIGQQTELLRRGRTLLESCGIPSTEIVAFRAGNFGANNDTWRAMKQAGLLISSNYNPCYFAKKCKIEWPHLAVGLFDTGENVWELPVTNFREPSGSFRHMQITAVSLPEMKRVLLRAHELGMGEVTLVTHSFEFFHLDSAEHHRGRPNSVNIRRLRGLARFLRENAHLFTVETMTTLARRLSAPVSASAFGIPFPQVSRRLKAFRLVEQLYKRIEARLPFEPRFPGFGRQHE
jgi:hypothetical protein